MLLLNQEKLEGSIKEKLAITVQKLHVALQLSKQYQVELSLQVSVISILLGLKLRTIIVHYRPAQIPLAGKIVSQAHF